MKTNSSGKIWHMAVQERNGLLLFFLISVILILVIKNRVRETAPVIIQTTDVHKEPIQAGYIKKEFRRTSPPPNRKKKSTPGQISKRNHRFKFNPNTISRDSFMLLGFSKFTSHNLIKYRQKGGVIKNLEQLKSIYGIDTSLAQELKDQIYFTDEKPYYSAGLQYSSKKDNPTSENKKPSIKKAEYVLHIVELNQADSQALVSIRGIGPHYAKKIINMKKKLGGFVHPDQLLECRVLPDSVFYSIKNFVTADPTKMKKIDINTADFKRLIQHPYLKENLVKVILHYREQHGVFKNLDQLKNIKILDRETFEKIIPHFTIENE